jgi:hypothetical protein
MSFGLQQHIIPRFSIFEELGPIPQFYTALYTVVLGERYCSLFISGYMA